MADPVAIIWLIGTAGAASMAYGLTSGATPDERAGLMVGSAAFWPLVAALVLATAGAVAFAGVCFGVGLLVSMPISAIRGLRA